jgi:hypothetical protein
MHALMFCRMCFQEQCHDHMKTAPLGGYVLSLLLLLAAILAPVVTICVQLPSSLFDFVVVTCVESHINKEIIAKVQFSKLISEIDRTSD